MRIGILTGGGDVPGLNPAIKAVVNRVVAQGHEIVGIRRGWVDSPKPTQTTQTPSRTT